MGDEMKILITGGAGFIGSNFVHYLLEKYDDEIVVLDKLTYAGNLDNLKSVMDRIVFVHGDICDRKVVEKLVQNCDVILNFAAETHVDRSIIDAGVFVKTDVLGTYTLLEASRRFEIEKYVQISTDEVYGSIEEGVFKEEDKLIPSSPYAASKAGADLLVHSYFVTHHLPVLTVRSSNNFGPYQYPEKLIPLFTLLALHSRPLPMYGDGRNVRDWIYVEDNCSGIDTVLRKGKFGEVYNIAGDCEKMNIEVVRLILNVFPSTLPLYDLWFFPPNILVRLNVLGVSIFSFILLITSPVLSFVLQVIYSYGKYFIY